MDILEKSYRIKTGHIIGLFTILCFFSSLKSTNAQTAKNIWLKASLEHQFSKRLTVDLEFQHRRQSEYGAENIFSMPLLSSFRPWLRYLLNLNFQLLVSPLAYYHNYQPVEHLGDSAPFSSNELRTTLGLQSSYPLMDKLGLEGRILTEYRSVIHRSDYMRGRLLLGLKYNVIPGRLSASFSSELLLTPEFAGGNHLYDQNRLVLRANYKASQSLSLEIGFIHIDRYSTRSGEMMPMNGILLSGVIII